MVMQRRNELCEEHMFAYAVKMLKMTVQTTDRSSRGESKKIAHARNLAIMHEHIYFHSI